MSPETQSLDLVDLEATMDAGARLARCVKPGMVITLAGELGAGKTTLVRGMLRGLGWAGPVKSPSYAWLEHYNVSSLYLYHFDFYRLNDPSEWEYAGFNEYFRSDSVCLIEWPERIEQFLHAVDLSIGMHYRPVGRLLTLSASTAAGRACLAACNGKG